MHYAEEVRQLRQKANQLYKQVGQCQDHALYKLADELYKKATWYENK